MSSRGQAVREPLRQCRCLQWKQSDYSHLWFYLRQHRERRYRLLPFRKLGQGALPGVLKTWSPLELA